MNIWKVTLKFPDGTSRNIELVDAKSYFSGYLKIKRNYFNALAKTTKITRNYFTGRGIEKVISPSNEDWTLNPWMLLIIKESEKSKPFWLFIKRERDLSGILVAIGPKSFANYINNKSSETKREIKRLINYIVTYLKKFKCIILLPNHLI